MSDSGLEQTAAELETIDIDIDGDIEGYATVVFDRPEAGTAMSQKLREEFASLADVLQDSDIRVVVLTGSDDSKSFVSGADVTDLKDRSPDEQRQRNAEPRIYDHVQSLPQPVIARINGYAFGGGCELAMACDVRVAREDAMLGLPEVTLGLLPGGGGTQRLPRLIGQGQASRLILTGDPVSAPEAETLGLVDIVTDQEDLDEKVYKMAASMAENSPAALELAVKALRESADRTLEEGLEYESELFAQVLGTDDSTEGVEAFLEDRAPEWKGR
jgi:enoyl-CoA hydratase